MLLAFKIDVEPVGKGRPRFTRDGHAYTPERTRKFEAAVRAHAYEFMRRMSAQRIPEGVPIDVRVVALFPIPKSWPKKKKAEATKLIPRIDVDNVLKAVLDAMNGVVFEDDRQIIKAIAEKRYSDAPGVVIYVQTPEEGEEE